MTWIDVHTHLNMLEIAPVEAVSQAKKAGVTHMISIGTHPDDLHLVMGYIDQFAPHVFGSLGIHPQEAAAYTPEIEAFLLKSFDHPRIVAAGEMGLDFYHDSPDPDTQIKCFRRQLELAIDKGLPVEIHTRDAEKETVEVLQEFGGRARGLLHCFTGSQWLADQALALGLNISISGIVTFKNAQALRDVVQTVPLDRLHVETDAPFLAPVPHRGKKNTPAMVVHTAQVVADLKGVELSELARITTQNAKKLFSKLTLQ